MPNAEPISDKPLATSVASTDHILGNVGGATKRMLPPQVVDASPRFRRMLPAVVGTRANRWANQDAYTTVTCATSRTRHRVQTHCTNLRLVYSGFKSLGSFATPSEVGMGNAWEVKAAIHIISSGTTEIGVVPVRFRGRRLALVPNAGFLESDPVSVDMPAGTEFFVYTFANRLISTAYAEAGGETGLMAATGANWPRETATRVENITPAWEAGVGSQFSTSTGIDPFTLDKVDGAYAGLTVGNTLTCGPVAILGDRLSYTGQPAVAWIGDSILSGAGDLARADVPFSGRGYSDQFLAGQCPGFNPSLGGDGIAYKVGANVWNFASRWQYVEDCDVAFVALGTNDLASGFALSSIQANLQAFAAQLKARGVRKVILATIIPRTTSTDGWATLANQTVVATNDFTNQRALFNVWALTVPSPFDAVIDLRSGVEDLATGKWLAPPVGVDATAGAGSTTTVINVSSPTLVASAHVGKQLIIGSEVRQITANTTNTITVGAAFTGAPATSAALAVRDTFTIDGIHPSAWGHKGLGSILTANASVLTI